MIFNRFALSTIRRLKGMSQTDLSHADSRSTSYISALENGDRSNPTMETIEDLAAGLGADPRALYVEPTVDQLLDELALRLADRPVALAILAQLRPNY